MKKIKVLIVAGSMEVGGIENQLMHLLRWADSDVFEIHFTTTSVHPYYEEEILEEGGSCIHLPLMKGKNTLRYCWLLYRAMRSGHYDIVHSHELFHSGIVLFLARLAGIQHRFAHAHSSNQVYGKSLIRRCYRWAMRLLIRWNATVFIACSSMAGSFLYGEKILQQPNYHVMFNSVNTSRFLPRPEATQASRASDDWRILLQVGRFSDEKNFSFTTQIAAECKRRGDRIRFWFVGNDGKGNHFEQEVKAMIAEKGLGDTVQLLGIRKDVDALMKQADAFILPSKYEGMPLTLIEAQAACLPCIVADSFSHEVDFELGAVRWLALDRPLEVWADAVEEAVHSEKSAPELVKAAIARKRFDAADYSADLCALYRQSVCSIPKSNT